MTPTPPFLVDVMCGTLATYLRFCGYDAAYALDRDTEADDLLLEMAHTEDRTLLTRDQELAARAGPQGFLLTSRETESQLRELDEAGLTMTLDQRPARCGSCNGPVEQVAAGEPVPDYARDPAETAVWRCRSCGQCLWKGSHWDRVAETLAAI